VTVAVASDMARSPPYPAMATFSSNTVPCNCRCDAVLTVIAPPGMADALELVALLEWKWQRRRWTVAKLEICNAPPLLAQPRVYVRERRVMGFVGVAPICVFVTDMMRVV